MKEPFRSGSAIFQASPPFKRACYTAPTRLASRAFCALFQNLLFKNAQNIAKLLFVTCARVFGWSLKQHFLFCVWIRWGRGACWATCSSWTGRSGRDKQEMKERLWHLTNHQYFMIVAEIFDILLIPTYPNNPKCPAGTCTNLCKATLVATTVCSSDKDHLLLLIVLLMWLKCFK